MGETQTGGLPRAEPKHRCCHTEPAVPDNRWSGFTDLAGSYTEVREKKIKREKKEREEESLAVIKILSPFRILSVNSFLEMLT